MFDPENQISQERAQDFIGREFLVLKPNADLKILIGESSFW